MKIFCDTHGNTNAPCNAMTAGDSRPVRLFVQGVVGLVALLLSLASGTAAAQNWTKLDGEATDIGVGASGTVWIIGTTEANGGYGIHRRDGSTWTRVSGAAERIAVGLDGNAWVVNTNGYIFAHENGAWSQKPGRARDIDVGADGSVWVIGTNNGIYRWSGSAWQKQTGAGTRIAVGPNGNAWVVNAQGKVWQWTGSGWTQRRSEGAADIGVGADGSVWITTTDDAIYRRVGAVWVKQSGGARHIAAGPGGEAWVVNRANRIYRSGSSSSATAEQRTELRSKRSDTAVKVRFLNSSAVPLKLHWIDYQGEEKEIGIIHPGKEQVMNTFATHPWRLKDMSAGVVALEHVTTETPATQLAVVYSKVDENGSMRLPDESANGATAGSLTGKDFFDALNPFDDDQTTCWRESYGRGVGTIPPSSCTSGKVNDAGLCYEPCKDGYQGIAHKCWQVDCPSGYRDDGLYCAKPFPAWNYGCPGGMTDIGVSCRKDNYVRGAGTVPVASCPSGKANDAGLCYEPCGEFYNGVGPVCWANTCPAEFPVDCGAACAKSTGDCTESIIDQTVTTVEFVANVASIAAGAGPVMKSGNRFISQTAKMSKSAIKTQLKAKAKQIGKKLGEEALETAASSAYQAQLTGGISFADLDPTGVTAVAAAFYRKTCDEYK